MRIRSLIVSSAALAAVILSPSFTVRAHAEETKIGIVDMQKAIQTTDAGKKARAALEKEIESKKKELSSEESTLKKAHEDYKKQSLVMSDDARSKKQMELNEKLMKYEELRQKRTQELQVKEQELTKPIVEKLRGVIQGMAKSKGYHLVLEKNEQTVLFSQDKDDLTNDVITEFNKQNKG
jgi:outer membrane protein